MTASSAMPQNQDGKPDAKRFIQLVAGFAVAVFAGVLAYGALLDAWNSNNPWAYVPAGIVLGIGYVIFIIYRLVDGMKSAAYREALSRARKAKETGQTPPA